MITNFSGHFQLRRCSVAATAVLASLFASGCAGTVAPRILAHIALETKVDSTPKPLTREELKRIHPNEIGDVLILEYHNILPHPHDPYTSTPTQFRNVMKLLYSLHYRPVSMSAYLNNKIDIPAGDSPVVYTFDDADESQYRILPGGGVDPNCAVGLMEAFHKLHPAWRLRGTFFVLPTNAFGQHALRAAKIKNLIKMGYEIGNHTVTHPQLSKLGNTQVQWQIAECDHLIDQLVPGTKVNTIALPYGVAPTDRILALHGRWGSIRYDNRAVLLAGADPAPAVISRRFNALRVPRVQPVMGVCGLFFWLKFLKHHAYEQFISDGIASQTTIPRQFVHQVVKGRLNGSKLVIY